MGETKMGEPAKENYAETKYKEDVVNRKGIVERLKILRKSLEDLGVSNDKFPVNISSSDTSERSFVDEEYIKSSSKINEKEKAIELLKEWETKTTEFILLKKEMMNNMFYGGGPIERDGSIPGVDY